MNKLDEYMNENCLTEIGIRQCSEYHTHKMMDRKYSYHYINYHINYDISEYDYLINYNDFDNFMKYLNSNKIENDGGDVFADAIRIVCKTNKVHDKIIRKMFNVIC